MYSIFASLRIGETNQLNGGKGRSIDVNEKPKNAILEKKMCVISFYVQTFICFFSMQKGFEGSKKLYTKLTQKWFRALYNATVSLYHHQGFLVITYLDNVPHSLMRVC